MGCDLSIVIVNWNTVKLLENCLKSIYCNNNSLEIEVIVIDNGSTDGSVNMVRSHFRSTILIENDKNTGFSFANNQGFRVARGRHVLLLNSDTLVHGDVLSKSVEFLDQHREVGAMGCQVLNADGSIQETCGRFPSIPLLLLLTLGLSKARWPRFLARYQWADWTRDSEKSVEVVSGCYLMIKKLVLDEVGPLDDSFFFFGEETDWCKRIRDAGWDLRYAPVGQITHFGSASARKLNFRRDVLLTDAFVHLHRKHNGIVHASIVWITLMGFNLSRAVFWTVLSKLDGGPAKAERAKHFWNVVANFPSVSSSKPLSI